MRGALFMLLFSTLFADAQNDTTNIYTYGGGRDESCNQIRSTSDKGYILIGTTSSFGAGNTSFYAVKTDSLCHRQWSRVFGGSRNQAGCGVAVTKDKGFAFVGYTDSYGSGGYDAMLVRTDSLGNVLWQKYYGGSDWDFGYSVKQTRDGGFILCGLTYSYGSGQGDVYMVRTDKNGDTLWTKSFGGTGFDVGNALMNEGDSLYVIAGSSTSFGPGDTSLYFLQIDTLGHLKNTHRFGCSHNTVAYSIAPASGNGYVMMGSMDSLNPGVRGQMLLRTDHQGNFSWLMPLSSAPYQDIGKEVIQNKDSTFLAVSTADGGGYGSSSMHIMHLDASGFWLAGPSFGGNNAQSGNSVTVGLNGNVLYAGGTSSYGAGGFDMYVVKWKNDSITQNPPLAIHNFTDTLMPAGIRVDRFGELGIKLFPNPMSREATLILQEATTGTYTYSLFDGSSKLCRAEGILKNTGYGLYSGKILREGLEAGLYTGVILRDGCEVEAFKLVVQ